jgi:hypothetical protein
MVVNLFDLLDRREVCRFFGGTKPLDPATLYRGILQSSSAPRSASWWFSIAVAAQCSRQHGKMMSYASW